jgi:hypothetical protein
VEFEKLRAAMTDLGRRLDAAVVAGSAGVVAGTPVAGTPVAGAPVAAAALMFPRMGERKLDVDAWFACVANVSPVVLVVGRRAAGKTELAIRLARSQVALSGSSDPRATVLCGMPHEEARWKSALPCADVRYCDSAVDGRRVSDVLRDLLRRRELQHRKLQPHVLVMDSVVLDAADVVALRIVLANARALSIAVLLSEQYMSLPVDMYTAVDLTFAFHRGPGSAETLHALHASSARACYADLLQFRRALDQLMSAPGSSRPGDAIDCLVIDHRSGSPLHHSEKRVAAGDAAGDPHSVTQLPRA